MRFQSLVGKDRSGGSLLPALTFSVVLHSLLLWAAPPGTVLHGGQPPLAATLRAVASPAPPAPSRQDPPAPGRIVASATARPTATALNAETAAEVSAPAASGAAVAAAAGREEVAPAGKGGAGAPGGDASGPDAAGILAYRIELAREMRNHRYPPLARERDWSGEAEVELVVTRQGRPRHILLARSSGHDVLDREALAMTTRAASAAALPPSLRGQAFTVRLPIEFKLTDSP